MKLRQLGKLVVMLIIFIISIPSLTKAQSLDQQLHLARQLEKQGRIQNALDLLETMYQNHPQNAVIFSRYTNILMKTQSYGKLLSLIAEREKQGKAIPGHTLLKARVLYRQGSYDQAMQTWNDILRKHPRSRIMYYKVASGMIKERLLEEALQVYQEGREKLKDVDLFRLNIVNVYEALLNFKAATGELIQYLNYHPERYKVVETKLLRYKGSDRIVATVSTVIRKAVKKQPENTRLKELLLKYFIETEHFQEGWDTAQKFFSSDKQNNENILFLFAENAFQAGSPEMAEKAYKKILKTDSIFIPVEKIYYRLGLTMEAQKQYEQAIEYYTLVYSNQKKNPEAAQAQLRKARILKDQLLDFEQAEALYRSLINQSSGSQELYDCRFSLGECLVAQEKIDQAEKIYIEAVEEFAAEKNQLWIRAIVFLGRIFYLKRDFEKSLEYLGKLSSYDIDEKYLSESALNDGLNLRMLIKQNLKDSPEPMQFLARAAYYEEIRKYTKAVATLDSLIADHPESNLIQYGLLQKGDILITLKQFKKSIKTFQNFLEEYPSDQLTDRALERLGWIYQKQGKYRLAIAYYENLLTNFPHSLLKEEVRLRIRNIEKEVQ
ncbi:MAG: tetratricopeptide repeat protein [bacterium]